MIGETSLLQMTWIPIHPLSRVLWAFQAPIMGIPVSLADQKHLSLQSNITILHAPTAQIQPIGCAQAPDGPGHRPDPIALSVRAPNYGKQQLWSCAKKEELYTYNSLNSLNEEEKKVKIILSTTKGITK